MDHVRVYNLWGNDALEEHHNRPDHINILAKRISNILQADSSRIQDNLHNIGNLFPELRTMCGFVEVQLDHLDGLALRDLGQDSLSNEYLDAKERFLEGLHCLRRKVSRDLSGRESTRTRITPRDELDDLRDDLNLLDFTVAMERAILRVKRSLLVLGGPLYKGVRKPIGRGYARRVTDCFTRPAYLRPASFKQDDPPLDPVERCHDNQWLFRHRLLNCYYSEAMDKVFLVTKHQRFKLTWCPILGVYPESDMIAAQIIPYTVGGRKAAYPLGRSERNEHACIWGTDNGIMLARELEKAFNEGSIVIVPSCGELRVILLNESLSSRRINSAYDQSRGFTPAELQNLTFGSINGRLLRFKTDQRPSINHLYIHAIMAVLRRRRHRLAGWEKDINQVFDGVTWPCKGKLPRYGTIRALAIEVGDLTLSEYNSILEPIIEQPEALDFSRYRTTAQDRDVATTVAGTWTSQKQCEIWDEVFKCLWEPE